MVIKYCLTCAFHQVKQEDSEEGSYCARENCFSMFAKCLSKHALKQFLTQESIPRGKEKALVG
jgi:hypothetical protein